VHRSLCIHMYISQGYVSSSARRLKMSCLPLFTCNGVSPSIPASSTCNHFSLYTSLYTSTCNALSSSIHAQTLVSLYTSTCDALSQVSLYSCLAMPCALVLLRHAMCTCVAAACHVHLCCCGMPCAFVLLRHARSLEC